MLQYHEHCKIWVTKIVIPFKYQIGTIFLPYIRC